MDIATLTYSPETEILRVKCRGRFGVGSEGQPSADLLRKTIEHWILNHANSRVTGIEVDYADVDYSWGDGPVTSIVLFFRQGVTKFHLVAGPSNHDAFQGLLKASNFPGFVLSRTGSTEVTFTTPPLVQVTAPRDETSAPPDPLDVLDISISDVGYWNRWVADLPERVELEFGGIQLAAIEIGIDRPRPIHSLSVRFLRPSSVTFIANQSEWEAIPITTGDRGADGPGSHELQRRPSPPIELTTDWHLLLQQQKIGPLALRHDRFTFHDLEIASAVIAEADAVQNLVGTLPAAETWARTPAHIAFWAGAMGVVITAEAMELFAGTKPISPHDITRMRGAWFGYWKEYWKRRGHKDALPVDWACEATIPTRDALD